MPDTSTILSLPYILPAQAQKHVTHNEALRQLDVIVQLAVTARHLAVPPANPARGDRYIVAAGASGDWAEKSRHIALFDGGVWQFFAPVAGWTAWIAAESALANYNGSFWVTQADAPQRFSQIGVSGEADVTNRLSVSSPATLFSHAGAGHQLKLNKATVTDTASLLFQTGFSGRAEMGTAGHDDFAIKVSADGSAFVTGLSIAGASGQITLPAALRLGGQVSDPVNLSNGMIWLNTTTGEVKVRSNGSSVVIASVTGITNSQLANMPAATFKGREAGIGAPQDLTAAQTAALLPVVTSGARGLAPASGGGSANFLRADGQWAAPPTASLPALGITATPAQINPLGTAFDNAFLGAGATGNLANGANDFGNNARWMAAQTFNGVTLTRVGMGIDTDGRPYVDYSLFGTASPTWAIPIYVQQNSVTPAVAAQVFTTSVHAQIIAGTPPTDLNTGVRVEMRGQNASGVETEAYFTDVTRPTAQTLRSLTSTLANAATTQITCGVTLRVQSGVSVDFTVRIKGLQFDRGPSRLAYPFRALSAAEARTAIGLPWQFTSAEQTITNGAVLTVAHGLNGNPRAFNATMICTSADNGYALGAEIEVPFFCDGGVAYGAVVSETPTHITVRTAAAGIRHMNTSGAMITLANASWKYIVRASL